MCVYMCTYSYKLCNLLKDLSVEYPYLGYEWFMEVRALANQLLPERNRTLCKLSFPKN